MGVTIKYDNYTFNFVKGPFAFNEVPGHVTIIFNAFINKSTSAALITEESTMLAACKLVKKTFSITFDGNNNFTFTNGSTGFNSRCSVTKVEDSKLSTLLSRLYKVSVDIDVPHDQDDGRLEGSYTITYDANGKILCSFSALYLTTSSQSDAYLNAKTYGPTWSESIITAYFSTLSFERIDASFNNDHNKVRCSYRATYKEIVNAMTGKENLFQNIVVTYTVNMSKNTGRPVYNNAFTVPSILDATINFSANALVRGEAGNINPTGTKNTSLTVCDAYKGYVASYIFYYLDNIGYGSYIGGTKNGKVIVNTYNYSFNPNTYNITAHMNVRIYKVSEGYFWFEEKVSINTTEGITPVKLWDGKPNSYVLYHTGGKTTLNRTARVCVYNPIYDLPELPANLFDNGTLVKLTSAVDKYAESIGDNNYVGERYNLYWFNFREDYLVVNPSTKVDVFIRSTANGNVKNLGSNKGSVIIK